MARLEFFLLTDKEKALSLSSLRLEPGITKLHWLSRLITEMLGASRQKCV